MASASKLSTAQVAEEAKYQLREIGKAARISRKLAKAIAARGAKGKTNLTLRK
ncbi:hypothetical protein [Holospora undulata]|uniref:Uncharacterized protein n=1 Tax=Holospora undulata HU1 TaxID=1321371 RepID=A0A061JI88_9PROT|nr:hypothetical protein [Holospora undulata]ETZ05307.1 hypothetical protein K737_300256 [Holospora undulata HU1]